LDLNEDGILNHDSEGAPRVSTEILNVLIDNLDSLLCAAKGSATNDLLPHAVELDFHLIQPRGMSLNEVHVEAETYRQQAVLPRMFVCGVIVYDYRDVQLGGIVFFNLS
jgi:hypothetical protein